MSIVDYKNAYSDGDLDKIYINGVAFKGISRDSALGWEDFVWSQEPTRSKSFAFTNMDDIDVGLVPRCEVNFKYFNINDFMKFREAIKQRYFQVKFFNVDTCEWMEREMYCSKSERQKLHYFNPKLVGVLDFSVNLVATNRELVYEPVTITYNANGYGITVSSPDSIAWSEQYYVAEPPVLSGREFSHWDTKADGTGWQYKAGQAFTAFKDTTLYAIYKEV